MPHISRKHLEVKEFERIYEELIQIFGSASEYKSKQIFYEFFTKTERVMFAKRLAVIALLSKDFSTYEIATKLAMSPATVDRMSLKFERGDYDGLVMLIKKLKFLDELELFLLTTGGLMPPIIGHRRVYQLKKKLNK